MKVHPSHPLVQWRGSKRVLHYMASINPVRACLGLAVGTQQKQETDCALAPSASSTHSPAHSPAKAPSGPIAPITGPALGYPIRSPCDRALGPVEARPVAPDRHAPVHYASRARLHTAAEAPWGRQEGRELGPPPRNSDPFLGRACPEACYGLSSEPYGRSSHLILKVPVAMSVAERFCSRK